MKETAVWNGNQITKNEIVAVGDKDFLLHCKPVESKIEYTEWDNTTLWDVYYNPSMYKRKIWDEWCRWAREIDAHIWITSANGYRFTIGGYVVIDEITYNIVITATQNQMWQVK